MHAPRFRLTHDQAPPAHPTASAGGFLACPVALRPCQAGTAEWVQEVYRLAYEQARAAIAPTWYDRAVAPSRN